MQVTGMLYGAKLLQFVGFPTSEVLGPSASEEEIKALIDRHGSVFIKPVFKGGVGKKGKAGLLGRASDLRTALKEKERLYFVEHRHGNQFAKANGVTFEGAVPAEHEIYFSITDSTRFRAPTMTLTHHGGMDIEELDKSHGGQCPLRSTDGPQGVRRGQRAVGTERAEGTHLAAGTATAQAVGALSRLRHDDPRAQSDPDASGSPGPVDARSLRFQVRLRPRRSAVAAPQPAGARVRRRLLRLRAGDQPAAHLPGSERCLRHQLGRARFSRRRLAAGPTRS